MFLLLGRQFASVMGKAGEDTCLDALRQQNQSLLAQLRQRQSKFKSLLNATTLERSSHFAENEPSKSTRVAREKLAHCSKAMDLSYRVKHVDLSGMSGLDGDRTPVKLTVVADGTATQSPSGKTLTSTPKRSPLPSGRLPSTPDRQSSSPYRPATTTPDRQTVTPDRPTRPQTETPRSILKHRKIIDDNVHVESRYKHTPTAQRTPQPKHNGLNYSYSNVDESFTGAAFRESVDSRVTLPAYSRATDGSYLEEYPSPHHSDKESFLDDVEKMQRERLLFDPNNSRQNGSACETPLRTKTVEFESPYISSGDEVINCYICSTLYTVNA